MFALPTFLIDPVAVVYSRAGPLVWVRPVHGEMTYRRPTSVVISEQSGQAVDGANRWAGLEEELHHLSSDFWTNERFALNTHRCNECEKIVPVADRLWPVHAVTLDGLTSLRHARCAVPGCEEDLQNYNADRCVAACRVAHNATAATSYSCDSVPRCYNNNWFAFGSRHAPWGT